MSLPDWSIAAAVGLFVGVLSGLTGVGGGIVLVPASTLLLGLTQHQAQGVSLAVIVPTSIIGAYSHWRYGNVQPRTALVIGVAAVLSGLVGALVAQQIPADTLAVIFGILLLYVAQRYLGVEAWLLHHLPRFRRHTGGQGRRE